MKNGDVMTLLKESYCYRLCLFLWTAYQDSTLYRVLSAFTNWVTGKKYAKGDRVLIAPADQKSFQWALDQGKLKKTGGRQRKKVNLPDLPKQNN